MKRNLGLLGIAVLLSVAGGILVFNWLADEESKTSIIHISKEEKNSGIRKLDIEFKDRNVVLNIFLTRPMSCEDAFETLGVEDLPLRGKVYSPVCTSVKPEKIVITYKEMVKT